MNCERCGVHFLAVGTGVVCNACLNHWLGYNPREEDFESFNDFQAAESIFEQSLDARMVELRDRGY